MTTVTPLASIDLVGRALLSAPFVFSGFGKVLNPAATASYMAVGGLPEIAILAAAVGVFEMVMGFCLISGYRTRFAAIALCGFTLVASVLYHAFWSAPADFRVIQQLMFMKNMSIIGGLVVIAAAGAGAWSLDSRRFSGASDSPARGIRLG